jgi:hypothetical protein
LALLLPLGATYHPSWVVGGGGGGGGGALGASTTMADVPVLPSLVAVIVADPPATPVTMPAVVTVATLEDDVLQLTERPVRTCPAESLSVAVNCAFAPTARVSRLGASDTDDTGTSVTVIADVPLLLSLVAVIVEEPGATAVTTPDADTVAVAVALEAHVTVRPVSVLPPASRTVAVSVDVLPTRSVAALGATDTDATAGTVTVTADESVCPSLAT